MGKRHSPAVAETLQCCPARPAAGPPAFPRPAVLAEAWSSQHSSPSTASLVQLVAAGFSHGFRQADQPCHHRQCPLRRVAKAQADAPVQHFLCSQHDRSGGTLEHLPVAWLQVKRQCRPVLQLDSVALDRYCCARRRRRHISSSECRKSEAIARL